MGSEQIAEIFKSYRVRLGLTIQQLADISGVPKPTIHRIESNKIQSLPHPKNLYFICMALGIDFRTLPDLDDSHIRAMEALDAAEANGVNFDFRMSANDHLLKATAAQARQRAAVATAGVTQLADAIELLLDERKALRGVIKMMVDAYEKNDKEDLKEAMSAGKSSIERSMYSTYEAES